MQNGTKSKSKNNWSTNAYDLCLRCRVAATYLISHRTPSAMMPWNELKIKEDEKEQ